MMLNNSVRLVMELIRVSFPLLAMKSLKESINSKALTLLLKSVSRLSKSIMKKYKI
jgi:hypothetical protein